MKPSFPSRSRAIEGEEGPYPVKYARARAVASRSWPANTVARISGRARWERASATAGRAFPAAQPQIELTTTKAVPRAGPRTASTSSGVLISLKPKLVSSSLIGWTISSGYTLDLLFRDRIGTPQHEV